MIICTEAITVALLHLTTFTKFHSLYVQSMLSISLPLPPSSCSLLQTQKTHKVTQFHIICWRPNGHCSNLKSVTDVIEEMTKVQIRLESGNKPIVVHCSDTVTHSGMFCAIATTIERCKTEGVVDVFQVVKAL